MTTTPLLRVDAMQVTYGKVEAVRNARLQVDAGQIVTIIGANGAGKSSLLNAIMGALPSGGRSRGEVWLGQARIDRWPIERRVEAGLALVPESRDLFGSMSVEENLLLGGFRRYRAGERDWTGQIEVVYAQFPRLRERARQLAATLSGGERQMLALGRALMGRPAVLLLDEPSLGLAPRVVRETLKAIVALRATRLAVIVVEQNARAALQIADHGYVMETGSITIDGPAAELSRDPRVIASYLGAGLARRPEKLDEPS